MHHVSTCPCFLVEVVTASPQLELLSGSNVLRTIWLLLVLVVGGCVSVLGLSREIEPIRDRYIYIKNWLTQLWKPRSPDLGETMV